METSTQTRREELEERIEALKVQEQERGEALHQLANEVGLEASRMWDARKAESHLNNATRPMILQKRATHAELLRAQAELVALQIAELDEELPEYRAKVDQLREQRQRLDAEIAEA